MSAGMFNIALVDIADDFGKSVATTQWVVTIYLLAVSICLPLMGAVGDMKGKRQVHNAGLFVFMLGGLGCALAPNLPALLAFRVLQGIGASMYQANNMALIVALFPPDKRGRALGTVSTFVAAGALIGPSLGGAVIEWFSWRTNFWLLCAVALGAWLLAQRYLPSDRAAGKAAPDMPGAALFSVSLTALVLALNLGNAWGWTSASVWLLFGMFGIAAILFARRSLSERWMASGRHPFIRLGLFNHAYIIFGVLLTVVTYAAAFATQLVLPVLLRNVMGVSPAVAGLIVMAYPVSLIVSAPISGGSSDRFGSAPFIMLGLGGMAASLTALGFLEADTRIVYVVAFVVLLGCSMGLITAPNNSIIMSRTPKQNLGMMSSMIALNRNLGMMFGAAFGGLLLSSGSSAPSAALPESGIREWYVAMASVILVSLLAFIWIVKSGGKDRGVEGVQKQESVV
ncbi:MFS transporter [Paenibacillus sp. IB182493]|uniref:MFS transporter n=1 Tax=Paenibacillus arenilitoris TaxID=2772299 RepID=A0A927H6C8_9BACL|nr:MFS transporter [Paenibacillus arenilitoris]